VWVARGWRTTLARHDRGGQQLLIGVGVLLGLDVVGGLLAIANDVNTPAEAWSSKATLAAPVPMIAAQAVLAGAAAYWPDRRGAAAAGVLATACVVSGVSGFFDGQFGRLGLPRPLIAFQAALVGATFGVGGLAIARAVRLCPSAGLSRCIPPPVPQELTEICG
jgi:hypothetical protein